MRSPARLTISQVDKIGEALKHGKVCADDLTELDHYRRTFESSYDLVANVLRNKLKLTVTGRPSKTTRSITDKLCRESIRLSQIQDIAGCRVVVDDIPAQDRLVRLLDIFLTRPRIVDRRTNPSHGYRAVHLVAKIDGRCVEVQVRTVPQHLWAEISEKMADAIDLRIKYGDGDSEALGLLHSLSRSVQRLETVEADRDQALEQIFKLTSTERKTIKRQLRILENNYVSSRQRVVEDLKRIHASFCAEPSQ